MCRRGRSVICFLIRVQGRHHRYPQPSTCWPTFIVGLFISTWVVRDTALIQGPCGVHSLWLTHPLDAQSGLTVKASGHVKKVGMWTFVEAFYWASGKQCPCPAQVAMQKWRHDYTPVTKFNCLISLRRRWAPRRRKLVFDSNVAQTRSWTVIKPTDRLLNRNNCDAT